MNCPKCNAALIDIKGSYFCSQCGTKVDLKELEEKLEKEVVVAKEEVKENIAVPKSNEQKESNAQDSYSIDIDKDKFLKPEEKREDLNNVSLPVASSSSLEAASSSHVSPPPVSLVKPQTTVLSSHKKDKLLSPHTIRIFLIVIIALNILILLGLSYFFLIK